MPRDALSRTDPERRQADLRTALGEGPPAEPRPASRARSPE